MNNRQILVLCFGAGLVILQLFVPPWRYEFRDKDVHFECPGPYALVFSPPVLPASESFRGVGSRYWLLRIDTQRLTLPIIAVLVATGALLAIFGAAAHAGRRASRDSAGEPAGNSKKEAHR